MFGVQSIEWKFSTKYLDVVFLGVVLRVDINAVSRKFYAACNSIYSKASCLTELAKIHLLESYCLPLLTYAIDSLKSSKSQCSAIC